RLQHIRPGDSLLVGRKPTGTLLIHDLHPGRSLYLLGTGTGLAPWLSIIKDPDTYERFERVIVAPGVRGAADLAYRDYILNELPDSGRMAADLGLEPLDPARDRAMICGSPQVLADFRTLLDRRGFTAAPRIGTPGDYVFERAFVEK